MPAAVVERVKVIDADTHVTEPADLWTSRVSTQKWGDLVPHVRFSEEKNRYIWVFGGDSQFNFPAGAMAGWKEFPPSAPPTLEDADPGAWNAPARLKKMDEYGIYAHVIYPNVGGFGSGRFFSLKEPELMLACVQAYNDFLADWTSVAPERFVPITALPFWDVQQSVDEIKRCTKRGHKGVLFGSDPDYFGQPYLADPYWDPVWATAQDLGLSINFHVGSADLSSLRNGYPGNGPQTNFAKAGAMMYMDNARVILEVISSGIAHRFPKLNFVSVESGVGWLPFAIEAMDWQWQNFAANREHPEMDLLPSEYFKRQVYACFWFERASARAAIDAIGPDNILYETDFPHPTSMSPGPASIAVSPKDFLESNFHDLPDEALRKILHDNAARIYHVE
jgi:uncharacterized protein